MRLTWRKPRASSTLWDDVRKLELAEYGRHFHDLDGRPIEPGNPAARDAVLAGLTAEQIRDMPMREYAARMRQSGLLTHS